MKEALDQQVSKILKQRAKAQGITQTELARALDVSHATLKRWLNGQGVTLSTLKSLCEVLGLTFTDLAIHLEGSAPRYFQYTRKQEEALSKDPALLAFFDELLRGQSPQTIQKRFGLGKRRLGHWLSKLDELKLLRREPLDRATLLVRGEPRWLKGGPLSRRFHGEILQDFVGLGHRGSLHLNRCLPEDLPGLEEKVMELKSHLEKVGARSKLNPEAAKPMGLFVQLQPYQWKLSDYLRG